MKFRLVRIGARVPGRTQLQSAAAARLTGQEGLAARRLQMINALSLILFEGGRPTFFQRVMN